MKLEHNYYVNRRRKPRCFCRVCIIICGAVVETHTSNTAQVAGTYLIFHY